MSLLLFPLQDAAGNVEEDILDKVQAAHEWQNEHPRIGRDTDYWQCGALYTERGDVLKVFSVWGMSSVGKSFLVKRIYCERLIEEEEEMFYNNFKAGWVNVSRPFNLTSMGPVRSLLLDLNPRYLLDSTASSLKDPIQVCREYLYDRDGLIVIDGLQSVEEWDAVKTAFDGAFKGWIIIITNEESVAKYCATDSKYVLNIKGLEADHAIELLDQVRLLEFDIALLDPSINANIPRH